MLCFPVTIAATAIFTYAWLVPLALWGFLFWRNNKVMNLVTYSFMETVCAYGYSLAIYIPAVVRNEFLLCVVCVIYLLLNVFSLHSCFPMKEM